MWSWLFWVVIGFYAVTSLFYLFYAVFHYRYLARIAFYLLVIGFVCHTLFFHSAVLSQGYPFILNQTDTLQLISWLGILLFLILQLQFDLRGAGAFFAPAALIFLVLSSFYHGDYRMGMEVVISPWAMVHLFLSLVAFTIFLVSIVVGIMFIMMDSQVKNKNIRPFFQRLPSLETLDRIHYRALTIGFVFLSLGILAGTLFCKEVHGVYLTGDPKQIWVLAMWFFFAILLNIRIKAGWRGRRGILLSLIGFTSFIVLILVYLAMRSPVY